MGPRIGRFDRKGQPVSMPGHSVPLSALGGLILVFGFFACNGTKQVSKSSLVSIRLWSFSLEHSKVVRFHYIYNVPAPL